MLFITMQRRGLFFFASHAFQATLRVRSEQHLRQRVLTARVSNTRDWPPQSSNIGKKQRRWRNLATFHRVLVLSHILEAGSFSFFKRHIQVQVCGFKVAKFVFSTLARVRVTPKDVTSEFDLTNSVNTSVNCAHVSTLHDQRVVYNMAVE